ncbi:MAG: xanthine dehydrogenase family protein subunit M [Acidimicrobiia bacterium]|nr:xanthine dehydrogenase family protein subunit M [Acidimicrobiia bacterium]
MKRLRQFAYSEPATLDEAVAALASGGEDARVLAGGTDLIVDMKTERLPTSAVVNIKKIPGLTGIDDLGEATRIGALTKVTAIEGSQLVQQRHPALVDAASVLASPPVRALATIGGNVGRASPASDLGPALIVSAASARIRGTMGEREELVEGLYVGPGQTSLTCSDIITDFIIPSPPVGFGSGHVKLGKRGGGTDIAMAGTSASVVIEDGVVRDCKIALASLGPIPFRAPTAEAALSGQAPTEETLGAAAEAAAEDASPIGDVRASASYRATLARVLTLRALRAAVASSGGWVVA